MSQTILEQGVNLMLYGMGTVAVFLALLVLATVVMSRLVRLFPEAAPPLEERSIAAPAQGPDVRIRRVITLVLQQHRKKQGR